MDIPLCFPFSGLPVESPVATDFWLPVEAVFYFPVETGGTVLAYFAEYAFLFDLVEAAVKVPLLTSNGSVLSTLLCNLFSLGINMDLSSFSLATFFSCFSFCSFFGALAVGSWPFPFFSVGTDSFSSLLEEQALRSTFLYHHPLSDSGRLPTREGLCMCGVHPPRGA